MIKLLNQIMLSICFIISLIATITSLFYAIDYKSIYLITLFFMVFNVILIMEIERDFK